MFLKVFCMLSVTSVVSAGYGHSSQHFSKYDGHHHLVHVLDDHGHHHHHVDYYTHPKYAFKYQVKYPYTGDEKEHHKHRDGDRMKGHYSLKEPDGTIRNVHYHADKNTGLHANVKHSHHYVHHYHHHH